jgi:hypothetical protein
MKLIYIRTAMVPKNYSALRSILKQEQGEKIAPCIFKLKSTQAIKEYLDQERIIYEVYQEEETLKRPSGLLQESRKKRKLEG